MGGYVTKTLSLAIPRLSTSHNFTEKMSDLHSAGAEEGAPHRPSRLTFFVIVVVGIEGCISQKKEVDVWLG